jgi:hypothetical protein
MPAAAEREAGGSTGTGNATGPPEETGGLYWCRCSCGGLLGRREEIFQRRVRKHLHFRLALAGLFVSVVVGLANLPQVVLHQVLCMLLFLRFARRDFSRTQRVVHTQATVTLATPTPKLHRVAHLTF